MRYEKYKAIDLPWLKEVPEHWEIARNKHCLVSRKDLVGSNFSDYTLLSLTLRGIIKRDVESGKGKFPESFNSYKIVEPGNLVFCLFDIDETPRTVGLSKHKGMITGAYDVFSVKNMNPSFAEYYWLNVDNKKALKPYYKSLRKTITSDAFLRIAIPIPPLLEQEKISNFLDWKVNEIDRLIKAEKDKKQNILHLWRSYLNTVLSFENETLEKIPLKHLAKSNLASLGNEAKDLVIDYIEISDIGYGIIKNPPTQYLFEKAPSRARRKIQENDIIISTVRTYLRSIWKVEEAYKNCIVSTGFSVLHPNNGVDVDLLYYVLSSDAFLDEVQKNSIGVSYPAISDSRLMNLKIAMPKYDLGRNIVKKLDKKKREFDNIIGKCQEKIVILQNLKQSLIEEVVSGKVNVQDIEIPEYDVVELEIDEDLENTDVNMEEGE